MVYILLGIGLGFIFGFKDMGDWEDGIIGAILGFLIGVLILITVGTITGIFIPTVEVVEEQEIVALTDSTSISGQKYLFSGYINEKLVCRYVVNTEKGKHIEELRSDNVYIKEGNYKPTVIKHKFVPKEDWYMAFCIPIGSGGDYTEFLVPENTITSEYNIDLR